MRQRVGHNKSSPDSNLRKLMNILLAVEGLDRADIDHCGKLDSRQAPHNIGPLASAPSPTFHLWLHPAALVR